MTRINIEKVKKCYICGSKEREFYVNARSAYSTDSSLPKIFEVVICRNCGFCYLSNRPTEETIKEYYKESSFYYDKNKPKVFPSKKNNKKVLDVGFGGGLSLIDKYEQGYECYGTDISDYAIENLNKLYPDMILKQGPLRDAKFPGSYFDLVTLHHVLEHEHDPVGLLKEIYRVLKKDGLLIIDIPNFGGLYYSLFKDKCEFFVPHHLSFFNEKTLSMAIEKAGFTSYEIKNIFGNNTSYHILHSLGIQQSYYQKTIFNKILGLVVLPIELLFGKGDALRAFVRK